MTMAHVIIVVRKYVLTLEKKVAQIQLNANVDVESVPILMLIKKLSTICYGSLGRVSW